ncbi:GGDEF domain-containing protein [Pseudomonas sp. HAR-UPW-AIA-41]|uniref:GGDEF domain-containing protein n=1 Tax=Pseudomonas sp. HAR-UPW-AIA-41 TaxID=1985301 RepID=UPI000BB3342C|nr:diguanylate cyclase [Pseudomonas sp. HAR-UPW-AIA-41]PAV47360.1 GGDEF domain-containing protein [Pseudomonas sp. HAR-UPW-AIA-41]
MSEEQRWKAKYLESLEQQEKLERRWDARLDLLRRGLVRSSLAAEGVDKAVDQCMVELREILRRDEIDAGLSALIPRLEKAVLDSEQRRQERVEQNSSAIDGLTQQLLKLELPGEVRKPLKKFSKQIEQRASNPRELPALLAELSHLQQQALSVLGSSESERPGLLQRLFGGRGESAEAAPVENATAPDDAPAQVMVSAASAEQESPLPESVIAVPAAQVSPAAGDEYALPEADEPGYSQVAEHIAASLLSLLGELELPPAHTEQGDQLRERLQGGLNWYELVPVLDDLAVLVLAASNSGQKEFAHYLKQLNERLAAFIDSISETHTGYQESLESAKAFGDELRQQVSGLQSSVQEATDLESLKRTVDSRLEGLLSTVSAFQKQRDSREQDMVERLQTLVARVNEMEQEAQGFRDSIEEQRQKALVDPLTGLPNRAAWNERAALEVARWQRYGGELQLAVLDVDLFKRINDNYGHLAGDRVLKIIAQELAKRLRKTDFIARFGGEEFVVLLPATPLDGAEQLLETLRTAIEACPFHFKGERLIITLSGGLASFASGDTLEAVFERADQALYQAKGSGRNRIIRAP